MVDQRGAKRHEKKSKTVQQRSRKDIKDKPKTKSRTKKDVKKKPKKGQGDKAEKVNPTEENHIKEKTAEKKKIGEEKTIPEVMGEKPAKAEEKPPAEKEVAIEKIKFHGRKSLSPEERKNIGFITTKKKKKPKFLREEMYKVQKLKAVWRRRRGIDSKKAEEKRGKGESPKIGYKKPDSMIGIDPSGYYPVIIHNHKELKALNPVIDAAIIAGAVGRRKRNEIIKMANELRITILNPRRGEI